MRMRRRTFIKAAGASATSLATGIGLSLPQVKAASASVAETVLPVGNAPIPVPLPHFPSRLHAFVWRNWSLVPLKRLAAVVGATPRQIQRVATAMGLDEQPRIKKEQQRRSNLTVIKRNWHLLPYDQLLVLLDWSAEQLAYTLREDDFLFVKLGSHKPKCERLRWSDADARTLAAEQKDPTDGPRTLRRRHWLAGSVVSLCRGAFRKSGGLRTSQPGATH